MATKVVTQSRTEGQAKKTFILVHGSWLSSGCWAEVTPLLIAGGHSTIVLDLPGLGLKAAFPQTYFSNPFDIVGFAQEHSPVAQISLSDYVSAIAKVMLNAVAGGFKNIVLVGHSSGGFSITPIAERFPEYISDLVYLAAHMEAAGVPPLTDVGKSYAAPSLINALLIGDPIKNGALRINWNSTDASYIAGAYDALAADSSFTRFRALGNLLTPDDPIIPWLTPTAKTPERWGRVRRSYIRTSQDNTLLPGLQDHWIAQADAFTPSNRTIVYNLDSSHTPFISQPGNVAAVLSKIARRRSDQ